MASNIMETKSYCIVRCRFELIDIGHINKDVMKTRIHYAHERNFTGSKTFSAIKE